MSRHMISHGCAVAMVLQRVFVLALVLVMSSPVTASQENPAMTATIMNIDRDTGVVTVRNDATGHHWHIKVERVADLQSLKVGQILRAPVVQRRSLESPQDQPDEGGCYERCRLSGSGILECLYSCANR